MNQQVTIEAEQVGDYASLIQLLDCLGASNVANRRRLFYTLFPDEDTPMPMWARPMLEHDTIFARHKYPKHLEFFEAGKKYRERGMLSGNRVGKTLSGGGYELAAHLTGEYPHWWPGRRFKRPITAWACGKTNETVRDILQTTLLGPLYTQPNGKKLVEGTGVIPGDKIGRVAWSNFTDLVDTIYIKHITGRWSQLGFKSYERGRGAFEGTARHVILLDEEPPEDIYGECVIRTATTNGIVMLTFTSLDGYTDVVEKFMPQPDTGIDMEA